MRPHRYRTSVFLLSSRRATAALCVRLQLGDNSTAAAEKGAVEEVQRSEKRVGHWPQLQLASHVCCDDRLQLVLQHALWLLTPQLEERSLISASSGFAFCISRNT